MSFLCDHLRKRKEYYAQSLHQVISGAHTSKQVLLPSHLFFEHEHFEALHYDEELLSNAIL